MTTEIPTFNENQSSLENRAFSDFLDALLYGSSAYKGRNEKPPALSWGIHMANLYLGLKPYADTFSYRGWPKLDEVKKFIEDNLDVVYFYSKRTNFPALLKVENYIKKDTEEGRGTIRQIAVAIDRLTFYSGFWGMNYVGEKLKNMVGENGQNSADYKTLEDIWAKITPVKIEK